MLALCSKRFRDNFDLKRHLVAKHDGGQDRDSDVNNNNEDKENESPSNVGMEKKVCPLCQESVKRLDRHLIIKHSVDRYLNAVLEQNKYQCKKCDKPLRDSYNLERHERSCGRQQESSDFECDLCHKKLVSKRNLLRHVKMFHETPLKCGKCSVQ